MGEGKAIIGLKKKKEKKSPAVFSAVRSFFFKHSAKHERFEKTSCMRTHIPPVPLSSVIELGSLHTRPVRSRLLSAAARPGVGSGAGISPHGVGDPKSSPSKRPTSRWRGASGSPPNRSRVVLMEAQLAERTGPSMRCSFLISAEAAWIMTEPCVPGPVVPAGSSKG